MLKRTICIVVMLAIVFAAFVGCADKDVENQSSVAHESIEVSDSEVNKDSTSESINETSEDESQETSSKEPEQSGDVSHETSSQEPEQSEDESHETSSKEPEQSEDVSQETSSQEPEQSEDESQEISSQEPEQSEDVSQETSSQEPEQSEDDKVLTEDYLYPDESITHFQKNSTGIYENEYVKLDATKATKGYLLVTYKDKYADEITIILGETETHSHLYVESYYFVYTKADFANKTIKVELPVTDAIYDVTIESNIHDFYNTKMFARLGQIVKEGAVSYQDMVPSEEQIKLKETSSGVYSNKYLSINTNTKNKGYVEVNYLEPNGYDIKIQITSNVTNEYGTAATWHYNTKNKGKSTIKAALTYGNAEYKIVVKSTMSNDTTGIARATVKANLVINLSGVSETGGFTLSTGEVIYNSNMQFIKKANEIAANCNNDFEVVAGIYDWLTEYLGYGNSDYTAVGLYTCDLEAIYASKKGVCYDFAVVFAAMVRSQGIPCKVVFGKYSDGRGHAWNEVYIPGEGSINTEKLSLTGNTWCNLDPTYTYSASSPSSIIDFMKDPSNYVWEMYY